MTETNITPPATHKNTKYILLFLSAAVFVLLCFIVFQNLGKQPLKPYDEAIYAQIAKQTIENKNYLGLQWLGNTSLQKPWLGTEGLQRSSYFLEKPPLVVWLVVLAYKIFGVTEFASRVWVALFALASMAFSFYFVRKIFNSTLAAVLALSFFLICYQYISYAGMLGLDIPVGFFNLGAVGFFYLAQKNPKYFYVFWLFLALGLMTKNIIGLFPLVIVGIYSVIKWDFKFLFLKEFWRGFGIYLLLILPWHIYVFIFYKQAFLEQYVTLSVLQRFSSTLNHNGGPWNYYINILQEHRLLFYSSCLSLVYFLQKSWENKKSAHSLVVISIIVPLAIFSASHSKLYPYILVLYPWLAILNGVAFSEIFGKIFAHRPKAQYALNALCIAVLIFFGAKFAIYKNNITDEAVINDKNIGLFLKDNYKDITAYNYGVIGTNPTIIFYSDRVIYFLEKGRALPEKKLILITPGTPDYKAPYELIYSTQTSNVYLIHG